MSATSESSTVQLEVLNVIERIFQELHAFNELDTALGEEHEAESQDYATIQDEFPSIKERISGNISYYQFRHTTSRTATIAIL
ncbi:hypothetical protein ANCCAN_06255 [Ancylostoma caninum]|uniref:Uncharacterized protein n=1 Tax=Ancylostoma caninum TaxID=29170 RepID=A0A368GXE8_ANCCA|nr:hypothetical protein ANCCAN_06255 [Ancylostoma caninum]